MKDEIKKNKGKNVRLKMNEWGVIMNAIADTGLVESSPILVSNEWIVSGVRKETSP